MTDTNDLTTLLTKAAAHLSGHPVRVRWRAPSRADARAIAFKSGDIAIIDLHPSLEWAGDKLLYTICHEAGHIKDLWHEWINLPDYPSGSIRFTDKALRLPVVEKIESRADKYAREWMEYAQANRMKYIKAGYTRLAAELLALLDWKP